MKLLALSGSLRAASINSALLRAMVRLATPEMNVVVYEGLGQLPLFNPDLEFPPPESVAAFQTQVAQADAVIIASPEYAHGVTGTIKNALDWLVGFEPFAGKLVAVINTSPRAHHADTALRETLKTMAAIMVESASINIPLLGAKLDEDSMVLTDWVISSVRKSLSELQAAVALRTDSAATTFQL